MKNQEQIQKRYLYTQNKKLQIQIKQLKQIINLHKEAIYKLSKSEININDVISILLEIIFNNNQIARIDRLNQKIINLQCYQMVLQKIMEQTNNDEKQTYDILLQEYKKLQQNNEQLQKKIDQYSQKIVEIDYLSGLIIKQKQIILPSQQVLVLKKQQDNLIQFIYLQKLNINKLIEEKNKLIKINIVTVVIQVQHMKEVLQKHKDQIKNMTIIINSNDITNNELSPNNETNKNSNILQQLYEEGIKDQNEIIPNNNNISNNILSSNHNISIVNTSINKNLNQTKNFISLQRKIIKENQQQQQQSQDDYSCQEINVLFPDKVQAIKKRKQINKIPQLMKKKQNLIKKQIIDDNKHINPTDKIIKLQTVLQITRKQLTHLTLKFKNMSEQLKIALKQNQQLLQRNQLLIASNKRLQTNFTNVYKDYQLTKMIALKVQRLITNQFDGCQIKIDDISSTFQLQDQKIDNTEIALKKIFGRRIAPNRSQSLKK